MNIIDNLYSSGPMAPVCRIKEHLAVMTENNQWKGFEVEFIEPIPRSSAFVVDLVVLSGVGPLAVGAQIAGQLSAVIQVNDSELCHFRWFVLDDVEAQLWQLSNMARFTPRGGQAGVNLLTPQYDPYLAMTTFWVLGGLGDKDARIGCTNIGGAVAPQARLAFFGYRYSLKSEATVHAQASYLPAQGR
jgi:hypothetical protein